MKSVGFGIAIALAATAYGQAVVTESATTVEPAVESDSVTIESMGFGTEAAYRGPGWSVEKYRDPQGMWRARFTANNAIVADLGDCGDRAEWMRFLTWPVSDTNPGRLLAVLRYEGGANGSDALDLFHLQENYRSLLDVEDDFNFRGIRDVNADGWPEIIGVSRSFANMMFLPHERSPFPLMVLGYHEASRQYVCLNFAYEDALRARRRSIRERFEARPEAATPIVYSRTDTRAQEPFGLLLQWVVSLAYMGEEEAAWQYLGEHASGSTYVWAKEEIEAVLSRDRYYQQMKRIEASMPQETGGGDL
jgi:hypothetical protein